MTNFFMFNKLKGFRTVISLSVICIGLCILTFLAFINPKFTSALNNIAVIYHYQGIKAAEKKCFDLSESLLQKATFYWTKVVKIDPNSYIEAWNWLKTTRRVKL